MPRVAVDDNKRMNLRIRPEQKATLIRAAALKNTDLTDFVIQNALREAKMVIEDAERLLLSERDSLLVLVSDGPRDLSALAASKAGPFVSSLNDADGRAKLGSLLSSSRMVTSQECSSPAVRRNNPLCSDAFGAALLSVEEFR